MYWHRKRWRLNSVDQHLWAVSPGWKKERMVLSSRSENSQDYLTAFDVDSQIKCAGEKKNPNGYWLGQRKTVKWGEHPRYKVILGVVLWQSDYFRTLWLPSAAHWTFSSVSFRHRLIPTNLGYSHRTELSYKVCFHRNQFLDWNLVSLTSSLP